METAASGEEANAFPDMETGDANEIPGDEVEAHDADEDAGEETPAEAPEGVTTRSEPNGSLPVHSLKSTRPGESECEQMAHRIETRRADRIPITFDVRVKLLRSCREICDKKGYESKSKIDIEDLEELRKEIQGQVDHAQQTLFCGRVRVPDFVAKLSKYGAKLSKFIGFYNTNETMLVVLDKAIQIVREIQLDDDDWFYFRDFGFYYTVVVSKWPWMRNPVRVSFLVIFFFYLFTPIFFCHIIDDRGVCEPDPTDRNRSYYGWMSSLYFASTTMSTVGYGDLSVEKSSSWRVFMGILYMILAMLVAVSAFSAAADAATTPLDDLRERVLNFIPGYRNAKSKKHESLHRRIRQLKFFKVFEITLQFTALNLLGFFVSRIFAENSTVPDEQWTWMESLYWSVQTTTTIGYGDLSIPFDMRWFNIFYLILGTYFVGNAFGKLSSLKSELEETRRYFAWERREVSKGMIEDFQAYEHDDQVDQFEFVLASLLTLGKVSSSDITPLMDKFRELAGDKGFIQISEDKPESDDGSDEADFSLPTGK